MTPTDAEYLFRAVKKDLLSTAERIVKLSDTAHGEELVHLHTAQVALRHAAEDIACSERAWSKRVMDHRHSPGEFR